MIIGFTFYIITAKIFFTHAVYVNVSVASWNNEFSKGNWEYMKTSPIERARISVIAGSFYHQLIVNGTVLDVGCGEAVFLDMLQPRLWSQYYGIDVSEIAISNAKQRVRKLKKRGGFPTLICSSAESFDAGQYTYDMIVFSEVLYYTDYELVLRKYRAYLSAKGVIVISLWHKDSNIVTKERKDSIMNFAQQVFRKKLDEITLIGTVINSGEKMETKITIAAFQLE